MGVRRGLATVNSSSGTTHARQTERASTQVGGRSNRWREARCLCRMCRASTTGSLVLRLTRRFAPMSSCGERRSRRMGRSFTMDGDQFDVLVRTFASRSRRRFIVGLVSALSAPVSWSLRAANTSAKGCGPCRRRNRRGKCRRKRPDGTSCAECRQCQGGRCVPVGPGTSCAPGKSCQNGVCEVCLVGLAPCDRATPEVCCSGKCSFAQPDVPLCEPHSR
jgi:hypothetical protein